MVKLHSEQLKKVLKPARYVAGEYNQIIKDKQDIIVREALIYLDLYERGMSDSKFISSYYNLNSRSDTWCERVFAPWDDWEKVMRKEKIELYGLESKDELRLFDILCININSVLEYTNILNILDLAKIPLFSKERFYDFPFIVANIDEEYNTLPIDPFIDFYIIGQTDKIYHEIIDLYIDWKKTKSAKSKFIDMIKDIEGIYVPDVEISIDKKKRKASVEENKYYSNRPVVPNIQIDKDYIEFELYRNDDGDVIYNNIDNLIDNLDETIVNSGISKIGFKPIDRNKYSQYELFKTKLLDLCRKRDVAIAFDSINLYDIDEEIFKRTEVCKKNRAYINVMYASELIRKNMGLGVQNSKIFESIDFLFKNGICKLCIEIYIGIKDETYMDIENIVNFMTKIQEMYYSNSSLKQENRLNIFAKIKIFENSIDDENELTYDLKYVQRIETKIKFLKEGFDKINIKYSIENPKLAQIKKLLLFGDSSTSRIVYLAWKNGAKLDNYEEKIRLDAWEKAINIK